MFFLYQIILSSLLLISPIIIIIRILKKKEDKLRFIEKLSFNSEKRGLGELIWFHGSSVGEIMSIIPLLNYYEKKKSIKKILVTSSTLSSSKIIKKFKFKKIIHQFYPLDHFFLTKKFINYWKPNLAIFIDSEIWPAMFKTIENKKIPLILLNARITRKTFERWIKFKNFSYSIFKRISFAFPQNKETQFFLKKLKMKNLKFIGNLKFIDSDPYKKNNFKNKLYNKFKKKNVLVAASTHEGEEFFCAKSHIKFIKKNKNFITVIIPRHIHRVKQIVSTLENLNIKIALHSSNVKTLENIDIYIVDTFGESKKFYEIGSTVFLGKSLTFKGGQNPLEAIHHGAKILHGPHIDNFKDVYKLLKSLNASKEIKTINQFVSNISLKKNRKIEKKIKKIGGKILKKTINELDKFINNEYKKT